MTSDYKNELLGSFLENYSRIYLIDLEKDTIETIMESEGAPEPNPVFDSCYSRFNRSYSLAKVKAEYADWREMIGSIENIRTVLADRSLFILSYQMKDGRWKKIEHRRLEMRDGVPTKAFACIPREDGSRAESDKFSGEPEYFSGKETAASQTERNRENLYWGVLTSESISTFEINVTRNLVVSAMNRNLDLFYYVPGIDIPGAFDVHARSWSERILSGNKEEFLAMVARENLLRLYEMGERDPWIEYLVQDKFGNRVWLKEIIALSRNEATGDLTAVIIMRDITEQKKIEIENRKRLDLIKGLTNDYESVYFVDLETDTYDIYRRNDRITTKYSKVFLPSYSETVETFAYRGVSRQDRENFIRLLSIDKVREVLSKKERFTFTFRSGNTGAPQYYQVKGVRIGSGRSMQMLLGFANIEEERQEELRKRRLLEDALEHARHADDAKSTFLSNMSHDIRTPMNAIIGFANIAKAHLDRPEKVKESLDKILTSSNHLLELINNVLDMSRIESGRIVLEESWCDIREIVSEVTDLMKPEILSREHEYEFRVAENVPEKVLCDRLRMTQLLLNLLSNAVKYTPRQGRIRLTVSQGLGAPAGYCALEFVISDTGIGMSREFQKKVFQPFERENNTTVSKVMGSGLGMPICKGIVDSMGGSMTVDSLQGRGTVITVNLAMRCKKEEGTGKDTKEPGAHSEEGDQLRALTSKAAVFRKRGGSAQPKKPEQTRILVVEDNDLNREIAKDLLEDDGFIVETAPDGETAILMIARSDRDYYDAVLMDVQMPGIDGYEATRNIRGMSDIEHAELPVIAMTANAYDDDMERAKGCGMNAYIAKPVEEGALIRVLRRVLPLD